jgi:xanthine dehydrogenase accessory factor
MIAIWRAAVKEMENGKDFVIATIIAVRGSSPRHVGTRFLIRRDGVIVGTIGGGLFEANVQRFAAEALEAGTSHRASFSFQGENAGSADMICGGDAEVLIEYVDGTDGGLLEIFRQVLAVVEGRRSGIFLTNVNIPASGEGRFEHLFIDSDQKGVGGFDGAEQVVKAIPPDRLLKPAQLLSVPDRESPVFVEFLRPEGTVYIFGAGHVGECVAHLASYVDFSVVVLDDRSDFASAQRIPDAHRVVTLDTYARAFDELDVDEDSYVVIVTHGHAHDKSVLGQALRSKAGYIGMIGSRRKTRLIFEALLQEGFSKEDIQKVQAPIGLPIGGETPQEIAVSIVAQMIQIRHKKEELRSL